MAIRLSINKIEKYNSEIKLNFGIGFIKYCSALFSI